MKVNDVKIYRMECGVCGKALMFRVKSSEAALTKSKIAVVEPCIDCCAAAMKRSEGVNRGQLP